MNLCKRVALCALFLLVLVTPVLAQERTATITLGRDPEPPYCVLNPGGTVNIFWNIQHSTTPRYVYYKLEDPTRTTILEQQTYPLATGLNISRNWTVPTGLADGKYWVRVEYWSFESSNEANAEVTFYVCSTMGNLCVWKFKDANCNGALDPGDSPVTGWWVCVLTPNGDDICVPTNGDGKACWFGIPLGHYTVYEPLPMDPAWQPVGPTSYEIDLVSSQVVDVQFLNVKYDECFGACCLPNGDCIEVKPADCAGVFYGLGSLCTGVVCAQPGACCDPVSGACTFILAANCPPGWLWIPDATCQPINPCPQLGACCDPLGNCTVTMQADCLPPSIWYPEWTSCQPNECPLPPGACCFLDGHCELLTEAACLAAPEHVAWLGPLTSCLPNNPCNQPGACCDLATGACTFVLEQFCAPPLVYVGGTCVPVNPCPQPGACCDPATGNCLYVQQSACPTGWTWMGDVPCLPNNPCPPPIPRGACCDPQGNCTITTQAECLPPNVWHPEWTSCEPNFCPPPVPTQNTTWGQIKANYR